MQPSHPTELYADLGQSPKKAVAGLPFFISFLWFLNNEYVCISSFAIVTVAKALWVVKLAHHCLSGPIVRCSLSRLRAFVFFYR